MKNDRRIGQGISLLGMMGILAMGTTSMAQSNQPNKVYTEVVETIEQPEVPSEGLGAILFASSTQETGVIFDNEKPKLSFQFKNMGQGPVTILKIKPACGCTAVELKQTTYAPGESGVIEVIFDPEH
ncbi:MAG: DUF1573 domain-containing protein [Phycisphaerales bacterium]|nr:DUF1573 domain-containing protein [Phycisphaerales bacterium]